MTRPKPAPDTARRTPGAEPAESTDGADRTERTDRPARAPAAPGAAALPIGAFAARAGVAPSALRFYEQQGLLRSHRSAGGHRLFARGELRRLAFVRVAQSLGLSLPEIRAALATLPDARTPTPADWERLSRAWQPLLDDRIALLVRLRDRLGACIGCGCLSLERCALFNPEDCAASRGAGARWLLGDRPPAPRPGRGR